MKLLIINGSPKKTSSNTAFYIDFFIQGFTSIDENDCSIEYVGNASSNKLSSLKEKIASHEYILFAFPVFYHAMPGNVRALLEELERYTPEKKVSFFIQQTYINSERSLMLIEHLESFCRHINVQYNGTVLKGAGPTAGMLKKVQNKYLKKFFFSLIQLLDYDLGRHLDYHRITADITKLGEHYGKYGVFNPEFVESYMCPERMSKKTFFVHKFLAENMYFRKLLKKYKTYKIRYDEPLIQKSKSNN